jgi:hypothetical protein
MIFLSYRCVWLTRHGSADSQNSNRSIEKGGKAAVLHFFLKQIATSSKNYAGDEKESDDDSSHLG